MARGQASKKRKIPHRYEEIESWLREIVLSGSAGELLPSEIEIANKFSVSRMTARQSVMNLMREGMVERKRGAGTFISDKPLHRREGVLYSFTDDMKRRGMKATSILISAKLETPNAIEVKALGLRSGEKIVVINRIRLADGIPLAIERVALIPSAAKVINYDLEKGSLHKALRDIKLIPNKADSWLSARVANKSEATKLKIKLGAPLLVETKVIKDKKGSAIERTETAYVANRYVVDIKLSF